MINSYQKYIEKPIKTTPALIVTHLIAVRFIAFRVVATIVIKPKS
ncbi:hypothetical protein ABH897_002396 [Paenibacillus sp. RC73]